MKKLFIAFLMVLILSLIIVCGGFSHSKNIGNIKLLYEDEEILNESFAIPFSKYIEIKIFHKGDYYNHYKKKAQGSPMSYIRSLNYSLGDKIEEIAVTLSREKEEPYYEYKGGGKFDYYEGENGAEVDIDTLCLLIIKNLSGGVILAVPMRHIGTETNYNDLILRTKKIANFVTYYSTSSANRKNNIKVACQKLNGVCIPPNESLSFNQAVGERTLQNGFLHAKIIQNGEFVEGIGGGVCQVSTTLYNVCLLAGLAIETSSTHSLPVKYVAPSLDAMVSSSTDLVIKNTSPYAVFINSYCDGEKLGMEIFGYSCGYNINLRSVIIKHLPCSEYEIIALDPIADGAEVELVEGKKPISGLVSESFRDYVNEKGEVFSERLRRSVYAPQKGIMYKKLVTSEIVP